jgi:hypothetical protein
MPSHDFSSFRFCLVFFFFVHRSCYSWSCLFCELQELVVRCMCIFFRVMGTAGESASIAWTGRSSPLLPLVPACRARRGDRAFLSWPPFSFASFLLLIYWKFDVSIFPSFGLARHSFLLVVAPGARYQCNMQFCQRIKVGRCEQQPMSAMK